MIAEIRLQQYRSYIDQTFRFSPGVNIIIGPNASGKTNILEAVMVACQGGSYRASDQELINHEYDWARIDLKLDSSRRSVKLIKQEKTAKQFDIDGKIYKRLGINQQIPIVLFEPNHLLLLSGSPELRRSYLDGILEQIKPNYRKIKNDYLKTLRHRNALLKTPRTQPGDMFVWNVRLSHLGGIIAKQRDELVQELNLQITDQYRAISNDTKEIELVYKHLVDKDQYESALLKKLESNFELDILRGFTGVGPHREDIDVTINHKSINSVASRGEARSLVVALKISEAEIIKNVTNQAPLILLDDVFSELDILRSNLLTNYIGRAQSILTTTNLGNINSTKHSLIRLDN